jgi:RNA polymerase-interacting CarD/CdnL/TRCF family regulator
VTLTAGNKVIYPSHGPCLIGPVVEKVVADRAVRFYRLALLDESGGELYVPVDKAEGAGIRVLLKRAEIPKLLSRLRRAAGPEKDWRQRASDNLKRLSSGSAFDLAEIVESLTERKETRALSFRESRVLERAKKLLVCEISEVMGETRSAAEEQVDRALKARKKGGKPAS